MLSVSNNLTGLKNLALFIFLFSVSASFSYAQNKRSSWNGKRCAVVLTYDDGTDFHLDNVIPVLDSLGIKATFYIPGHSKCLYERMDEWKAVAQNGHELGNHTMFHPCHGKSLGRKWVNPDYDLDNYTVSRFINEVRVNNTLLKAVDGKEKRTFAYTCGDMSVNEGSFVPLLKKMFVAARGTKRGLNFIDSVDLFDIKIFGVHKQTSEELIKQVKKAKKENALLVFLFHGVGGGSPYSISTEEHSKFVHYLKQNEKDMWVAPMVEVANYILSHKK